METLLTTFKSVGTITSYILRVHLWTKGVLIQKSKRLGSSEEDQCLLRSQHCSPQWREWTQTVLQLGGVTDFLWEVTERGNIPFVGCPGTKLGFQSMKNRNIIMVMIMMILIIDSLHVSGWCVQHCCLSIRSPWTQLKRLHLRKTFSVTSNADIVHRFHFATDLEFDAGWIVRHWNPWLVLVLILVHIIVLDEGGSGKMCEAWKMLNLST